MSFKYFRFDIVRRNHLEWAFLSLVMSPWNMFLSFLSVLCKFSIAILSINHNNIHQLISLPSFFSFPLQFRLQPSSTNCIYSITVKFYIITQVSKRIPCTRHAYKIRNRLAYFVYFVLICRGTADYMQVAFQPSVITSSNHMTLWSSLISLHKLVCTYSNIMHYVLCVHKLAHYYWS